MAAAPADAVALAALAASPAAPAAPAAAASPAALAASEKLLPGAAKKGGGRPGLFWKKAVGLFALFLLVTSQGATAQMGRRLGAWAMEGSSRRPSLAGAAVQGVLLVLFYALFVWLLQAGVL